MVYVRSRSCPQVSHRSSKLLNALVARLRGRSSGPSNRLRETDKIAKTSLPQTEDARLQAAQDAFDKIYRQDLWALRTNEYGSDRPGIESEQARNTRLAALIQDVIRLNDVKSVVEFGCGYWSYASEVDWTGVEYHGFDIVEEVIEANQRGHARGNVRFHVVRDGTRMPKADLMISKDVMQHLPTDDILHYLSEFKTNFRLMLIGNDCLPDDCLNGNITHGEYRPLRLELPPFNYPNIVLQQWRCLEFGTSIVKNFCLLSGEPSNGDPLGITLRNGGASKPLANDPVHVREVVGLDDASASGWGNIETGDLFDGFRIQPADTVVDVGCGIGSFVSFVARKGPAVVLIDMDPEKVSSALTRVRETSAREITPIVSDCAPIPLPDSMATAVICTEVLEHVPDPDVLMAELVRLGAPGARYLLSVPHSFSEGLQKKVAPDLYFQPPNHVRVFSEEAFKNLVMAHGLIIDHFQSQGFFWSVYSAMVWSCDVSLGTPHPALDAWAECWSALLKTKDGTRVKAALDEVAPNTQVILAHKP